ncbi:hypothetical protein [Microvirga rosea]|uniref:hypothetical protein n=1 Tax=Microvirga rosea TaxID=2715425 RepID=UPI001D0A7D14|nr:hypothetical protein [Microvirga rosea]MCB8822638.1 hypothetical protein [Microvirga rosea]
MKTRMFIAVMAAVAGASIAHAEEPPKMVGTWKGMAQAVHIGSNPYRVAEKNGPNFSSNEIEFTFAITEQQGNRFAGTSSNGRFTETLIGAIGGDNKTGIMTDDDGSFTFALRDPNTLDVCYHHSFATSRVVSCWSLKRTGT